MLKFHRFHSSLIQKKLNSSLLKKMIAINVSDIRQDPDKNKGVIAAVCVKCIEICN